MRFYRIGGSRPWGDYGAILVHGMSRHLPRLDGLIRLERTGPFIPPITLPGIGDVVVTHKFRAAIERTGLAGLSFAPVIKTRIVEFRWELWDPGTVTARTPRKRGTGGLHPGTPALPGCRGTARPVVGGDSSRGRPSGCGPGRSRSLRIPDRSSDVVRGGPCFGPQASGISWRRKGASNGWRRRRGSGWSSKKRAIPVDGLTPLRPCVTPGL